MWAFLLRRIAVGLLLVSCSRPGTEESSLVDDLGRVVALEGEAHRVVSLAPSISEVLFAIGAGDRVVGRTQWGVFPPELQEVPSVGNGLDPSVETVAARNPELVVFYASSANDPAIAQFGDLGIATASLRMDRLVHVAAVARFLGPLVGAAARADSLASSFEAELAAMRERIAMNPARCSVAVVAWDNPPMVLGSGSFVSEILELAGARNAFEDVSTPDAEVSIETIAARDPDLIVVFGTESPAFATRDEWRVVPAVRDRRFLLLDGTEFQHPSFRALDAARSVERRVTC